MSNRTDFAAQAIELAIEFDLPSEAIPRLEIELHNAYVAGEEGQGCMCSHCVTAPPSPETTKPEPLPDTEGRCHFYYGKEGGYCYSAAGDPCPAHGGVISSSRAGDACQTCGYAKSDEDEWRVAMKRAIEAARQVARYWGSATGATPEQVEMNQALAALDAARSKEGK